MPTNEERREVAARLREVKKTGLDFTWCKICMGVCGPDCPVGCDEDEMAVDVAKRLADLIEPEPERTCEWVQDEDGNWHTSCGEVFTVCNCESFENNNIIYCHNCGAKVVEQ